MFLIKYTLFLLHDLKKKIDFLAWGDEQRQLLGTEEEADSSDCETVSSTNGVGIWSMNEEQSKYYTEQFALMQPNPKALLSGSIARSFFEKSRLPFYELKEIWYLYLKLL